MSMNKSITNSFNSFTTSIIFSILILGYGQGTQNNGWNQLTETLVGCSGRVSAANKSLFVYSIPTNRNNVNFLNIKSWDGETWRGVGHSLKKDVTQPQQILGPSLISDHNGKPIVAWSETISLSTTIDNPMNLWVKHWNGTSWEALGDNLRINGTKNALFPSLAADSQNNVFIAWQEGPWLRNQDSISNSTIYLKRWDGTQWLEVAPPIPGAYPNLAIDADGMPVIAYVLEEDTFVKGKVAKWDGSSWEYLGNMLNEDETRSVDPHSLSIAFNGDGQPIVASRQDVSYKNGKFVVQQWTGKTWQVLDGQFLVDSKNIAQDISLYAKGDKITVAFTEYEDPRTSPTAGRFPSPLLYVKIQESGAWQLLNEEPLGYDVVCSTIWIDEENRPVVAWQENNIITRTPKFVVSRFEQ